MKRWGSIFVFTLVLAFMQCRKEENSLPSFEIIRPFENSQWAVHDTIDFEIANQSSVFIKQVKVCVINSSFVPVTSEDLYELIDNSWDFKGEHIINNSSIETGTHYFRVMMIDKNGNTSTRYSRISISELPLRSEALYVVGRQSNSVYNVYRCDSFPEYAKVLTLNTDFSGSAICSSSDLLYVCGKYTGPLAAYDIDNSHQLLWQEDALLNPPFPWFEGIDFDGRYLTAGYTDNRVKGFLPGGSLQFVFELDEYFPRVFLRHYDDQQQKEYLVIGASHYSGLHHLVSVHYDMSYSNMQFLMTTWEVHSMFSKNYDEIYMFGNESGQAVMKIYKISDNNFYVLKLLPTGKLYDVVRISSGVFLISHDQGVFMYQSSTNSLTPYGMFPGKGTFSYDQVSGKCFYATGGTLTIFDYMSSTVEGNVTFADSIVQMHILFNK
jgi:hypothetical protein